MPRSADLRICLFPLCESPQRCYISTDRSGSLLSVFINSIFNVFTCLYSSHVQAKAHSLLQICFFVACLCTFSMGFLLVLMSHYTIYQEVCRGVVYSLISMSTAVSESTRL